MVKLHIPISKERLRSDVFGALGMSFQKALQKLQEVSTSDPFFFWAWLSQPPRKTPPKEHPAAQDLLDIFDGQDPLPYLHVDLT